MHIAQMGDAKSPTGGHIKTDRSCAFGVILGVKSDAIRVGCPLRQRNPSISSSPATKGTNQEDLSFMKLMPVGVNGPAGQEEAT